MDISNDLTLLLEKVRYEVQYVDYKDGQFTVPVILTSERAKKIIDDNSIKKVRFSPILGNQGTFTFEHQYLVYENKN
jgi:hypothetical protein